MLRKSYIKPKIDLFKMENASPLADSNHLGNATDEEAGVKADLFIDSEDVWSKEW